MRRVYIWILLIALSIHQTVAEEKNISSSDDLELEDFALQTFGHVVKQLLTKQKEFIANILQDGTNEVTEVSWLKRYMTGLASRIDQINTESTLSYESLKQKLSILKSSASKELPHVLTATQSKSYQRFRENLTQWFDEEMQRLRPQFDSKTKDEPLRNQYLCASFDDIGQTRLLNDKLIIFVDIIRIIVKKVAINYTDLYVQK